MKIALLSAAVSTHSPRWANGLSDCGHDVTLISQHPLRDLLAPAVRFEPLPVRNPAGYFLNAGPLNRLLAAGNFDILHGHFASGYGTLLRRATHRRKLLSVWGSDVTNFPGKSPLHRAVLKANLRAADHVCVTSDYLGRVVNSFVPMSADRLTTVPFGVDTAVFSPRARQARSTLVIGSMKALEHRYGMDVLIRAFARVLRLQPDLEGRLSLRLYGDGSRRTALLRLIATLGVTEQVELRGWIAYAEVPAALRQLDIFVVPSRQEGFGVAALEAAAAGIPVVAAAVGGLPEVVNDGTTGLLVEAENVEQLAAALRRLANDSALRETLGQHGPRWVTERFAWQKSLDAMNAVYTRLGTRQEATR